MKQLLYCFILLAINWTCKKDFTKQEKELTELEKNEWFRNLQRPCSDDAICMTAVHSAVFGHMTVYYSTRSGALCDPYFSATLYNEDGIVVKTYSGPNGMRVMESEVSDSEIIWRCDQD